MRKGRNIAITGIGVVSAIGKDVAETLESLRQGRSGIGAMRILGSIHRDLPVGEVKLTNVEMIAELGVEKPETSRTVLLAVKAAREAMADAGIDRGSGKKKAFLSGTTVGGMDITERHFKEMRESGEAHPCIREHSCGSSTEETVRLLGLDCERRTISTACSSAANAIAVGARMLSNGEADVVIAGGTESLSVFHLNGFNSLMILDREECRPFDATRQGLNLGEGAAYIVMKRKEDCGENEKVYGYLRGWGNACDAFHQTATSENGRGAQASMKQALEMAGLRASDIDYINAHGTGTPNNDLSETRAILGVFGKEIPPVSSTKSLTGHTTSASGSIEAVISLLAMEHGFIPGNRGFSEKIEGGFEPVMLREGVELRHVLCNSFGFGGNDTSLVLSKEPGGRIEEIEGCKIEKIGESKVDSTTDLTAVKAYLKPMELRRMGKLMKGCLLSVYKAMEEAGVEKVDAIVCGTDMGCLESSEKFLDQMVDQEERMLQPTHFMQSTHNTLAGQLAIRLGCQGYNITYSHGEDSKREAIADAEDLLRSGKAECVLVGRYDESTSLFTRLTGKAEEESLQCETIILRRCGN